VVPTISLVLAVTFAVYGLLRKRVAIDAAGGLFIETALLIVPALGYLALAGHASTVEATRGKVPWLLLALAGPITALPLLWFANAARRLPLAVLGFVQYISPTLQLACAVLLFGERFTAAHALTFALIWAGVALFVSDSFQQLRAQTESSAAR
jgi:chloramphenicol-sensitive protein RarD